MSFIENNVSAFIIIPVFFSSEKQIFQFGFYDRKIINSNIKIMLSRPGM